jgi:tryptophan synthase alpha chain
MSRIDLTFRHLKRNKQTALIGYITAGYPTKASLRTLVPTLAAAGLDLLEIGVPFSDPIADGPTIQHSSQIALRNRVTLAWILSSVKLLRKQGCRIPVILMSYCNPLFAMGLSAFFQRAKASGVDGVIIPDLIPEEARPFSQAAQRSGIDLIYLVAPTTPKARLKAIAQQTHGFLYAVSLTGVTGMRKTVSSNVSGFLKSVKTVCRKPVAVGFGLSTPTQVRQMAAWADGVIVGSALIREIGKSKSPRFDQAARFVRSLKGALHAS